MLNLTQEAKHKGMRTFGERLTDLLIPEVYLAENVADFRQAAPETKPPLLVRLTTYIRFYVVIYNIGIERCPKSKHHEFFLVSDATGGMVVLWPDEHNLVFRAGTPVESIPGVNEGKRVLVHRMLMQIADEGNGLLPVIMSVTDTERPEPRGPKRRKDKKALLEHILEDLAEPEPA